MAASPVSAPAAAAILDSEAATFEDVQAVEAGMEDVDAPAAGPLEWTVRGDWVLHEERVVPVDDLEFDSTATSGQIRVLSDAVVEERVQSMLCNMPSTAPRVLLWQPRVGATRFVVLGGQHTVAAMRRIRELSLRDNRAPPRVTQEVVARVLRPDTPLEVRQRLAGDHQAAQADVREIPLWRVVGFMVEFRARYPDAPLDAVLQSAIQKSGRSRPTEVKRMRQDWLPLWHVGEALQAQAMQALQRLEERGPLTLHFLRCLRGLLTPQWRSVACRSLLERGCTPKKFQQACTQAIHEQWVSWHWRQDNPRLDAHKGVFLRPLVPFIDVLSVHCLV